MFWTFPVLIFGSLCLTPSPPPVFRCFQLNPSDPVRPLYPATVTTCLLAVSINSPVVQLNHFVFCSLLFLPLHFRPSKDKPSSALNNRTNLCFIHGFLLIELNLSLLLWCGIASVFLQNMNIPLEQ